MGSDVSEAVGQPAHRDPRALGDVSTGEMLESFRRAVHFGEEGAKQDARTSRIHRNNRCIFAARMVDQALMDSAITPAEKLAAVAAMLGYVSETYGGWCRLHIPLAVEHR